MEDTTRRTFLKAVAALGVAAIAPIRFVQADEPLAIGETWIADVRETIYYNIECGQKIRHDILYVDANDMIGQLGCDQLLTDDANLDAARRYAIVLLREHCELHGIDLSRTFKPPTYKVGTVIKIRR